jgi:hypothetical protein
MSESTSQPQEVQSRFESVSRQLGGAATELARVRANHDTAKEGMRAFLTEQVGSTLLLQGYATWVGFRVSENRWTYMPRGRLGSDWSERVVSAGKYVICGLTDSEVEISVPGSEETRRQRAPINLIRSATTEEVEAVIAARATAALEAPLES